jgi:hypothetical protein
MARETKEIGAKQLYKIEEELYYDKRFDSVTKQSSLLSLKRLANKIWRNERIKWDMPVIMFGVGTEHGDEMYSWCDGETIELAPNQRDKLTLIHELVHAMGYPHHNNEFVAVEKKLLRRYTTLDRQLITKKFRVNV